MGKYVIAGKPVRDANQQHRFTVKRSDIDDAIQGKDSCCAAAIAIERQPGVLSARVTWSFTLIEYAREWRRYTTPKPLQTAIALFDAQGVMIPQPFILQPVRGVRRLENRGKAVRRHAENVVAGTARVNQSYRKRQSILTSIPSARPRQPSVQIDEMAEPPHIIGPMPRLPYAEPFQTGQTQA